MNNIAKFEETKKALEDFKQRTVYLQEDLEKKEQTKGLLSKSTLKALVKDVATRRITIDPKKDTILFESNTLGRYLQFIHLKKRRLNVLPLCFLVQMYKEEISRAGIKEAAKMDIPFELRGFWKMEKAIEFVDELEKFQREAVRTIQRQINYNKRNEENLLNLSKIGSLIESIEISAPKSGYMNVLRKNEIVFKVNMKNTKLDVVPLCKIVTTYYVEVITTIDVYVKKLKGLGLTNDLMQIAEEFEELVKKYFIIKMIYF